MAWGKDPGVLPGATGNTPEIVPTANPSVLAIAGRYAIIKPRVMAGEIAGYYVGIPGAGHYFKVDYSKPREINGRNKLKRNKLFQGESNADSSIVIVLPPNISVPDTFCVTYYPYDPLGNIGQPVTTCIYVSSLGTTPSEGWLQNEFRITAVWEEVSGVRENLDSIIYNRWYGDGATGYFCDQSTTPPTLYPWSPFFGPQTIIISDSLYYFKNNLRFAVNGAFDNKEKQEFKSLDSHLSDCSQFLFYPISQYADSLTGGYHYDAVDKTLILIFEFNSQGFPEPEYWEYTLTKVNSNHFILFDPIENWYIRCER